MKLLLSLITVVSIALNVGGPIPVLGQMEPAVRDRAVSAAVQIALLAAERDDPKRAIYLPAASGTVVSPDGLILTNQHVVDEPTNRASLEQYSAAVGTAYDLLPRFLVLATAEGVEPVPAWEAEVVARDAALDLAVLRVVEDHLGNPLPADPALPFVELGDSDAVQLGDPIDVFGYPVVGGNSLTYTSGSVSGFLREEGIEGRAWIKTDAVVSGGSSGGTAVDRAGRLIGVPTRGAFLDCRPVDANGDGVTDAADGACLPTGGSIGEMRPVNLALPLLEQAGWRQGEDCEPMTLLCPAQAPTEVTTTPEGEGAASCLYHGSCPDGSPVEPNSTSSDATTDEPTLSECLYDPAMCDPEEEQAPTAVGDKADAPTLSECLFDLLPDELCADVGTDAGSSESAEPQEAAAEDVPFEQRAMEQCVDITLDCFFSSTEVPETPPTESPMWTEACGDRVRVLPPFAIGDTVRFVPTSYPARPRIAPKSGGGRGNELMDGALVQITGKPAGTWCTYWPIRVINTGVEGWLHEEQLVPLG